MPLCTCNVSGPWANWERKKMLASSKINVHSGNSTELHAQKISSAAWINEFLVSEQRTFFTSFFFVRILSVKLLAVLFDALASNLRPQTKYQLCTRAMYARSRVCVYVLGACFPAAFPLHSKKLSRPFFMRKSYPFTFWAFRRQVCSYGFYCFVAALVLIEFCVCSVLHTVLQLACYTSRRIFAGEQIVNEEPWQNVYSKLQLSRIRLSISRQKVSNSNYGTAKSCLKINWYSDQAFLLWFAIYGPLPM